ncbi:hypothetical protein V8G54_003294 [Vigna mungo]|uniref:Uncharacterized protein n=1 Tax=Vigna mungo TaxID=3915 RepID=A0AAQ3PA74_VIGMU
MKFFNVRYLSNDASNSSFASESCPPASNSLNNKLYKASLWLHILKATSNSSQATLKSLDLQRALINILNEDKLGDMPLSNISCKSEMASFAFPPSQRQLIILL